MKLARLFFVISILLAPVLVSATSITYTERTWVVLASFDGAPVSNTWMTMSWTGDTDNVGPWEEGGYYRIPAGPNVVNVTIGGVGSFLFSGDISVHAYQKDHPPTGWVYSAAGFECTACGASIVDTRSDAFDNYTLITSIGPITGESYINVPATFYTTGGVLDLYNVGDSTFTARLNTVPEPSSLLLAGTAVLGALGMLRRKLPW